MKFIELTQGKKVIVDDEDYENLMQWKWFYKTNGYAVRNRYDGSNKPRGLIRMHRQLIGTPKGKLTDHINGDKLDNRKANLRVCNTSQNNANRIKLRNTTSRYKGVYWRSDTNKWQSQISINGRQNPIGNFPKERWAAMAYDIWAKDVHKEFANLNF